MQIEISRWGPQGREGEQEGWWEGRREQEIERERERAFECLIRVTLEIMFDRVWVVREFKSPQQGTLIAK